jgi:ABC transporter substrate binding protein
MKRRANAVVVVDNPFMFGHRPRIIDLAARHRLPTMHTSRAFVEAGAFASYGRNQFHQYRRAAQFVDRILKGAKPSDLPVEQSMEMELVINMKTALGLTIPRHCWRGRIRSSMIGRRRRHESARIDDAARARARRARARRRDARPSANGPRCPARRRRAARAVLRLGAERSRYRSGLERRRRRRDALSGAAADRLGPVSAAASRCARCRR